MALGAQTDPARTDFRIDCRSLIWRAHNASIGFSEDIPAGAHRETELWVFRMPFDRGANALFVMIPDANFGAVEGRNGFYPTGVNDS